MKIDPQLFNETIQRLSAALPAGLQSAKADIETNFRSILQAMFAKFDLVSREEFEVQTNVLAKTREKLAVLEQQIKALEEQRQQP